MSAPLPPLLLCLSAELCWEEAELRDYVGKSVDLSWSQHWNPMAIWKNSKGDTRWIKKQWFDLPKNYIESDSFGKPMARVHCPRGPDVAPATCVKSLPACVRTTTCALQTCVYVCVWLIAAGGAEGNLHPDLHVPVQS